LQSVTEKNVAVNGPNNSILAPYHPRRTEDQRRKSHNGFHTPASPIMPSAEEFISLRVRSRWVQTSLYLWLQILGQKNRT